MTNESQKLFRAFENALFLSASDEYNESASDSAISRRYEAARQARQDLVEHIEKLEENQPPPPPLKTALGEALKPEL